MKEFLLKLLEIFSNPYVFLVASALVIIGLTQLIKLIPCFRNNNWNISFPILFGYCAAFGWALMTNLDISTNLETLIPYGTGIGTLSTTLYGILKKIFNKNYKMENEIEKSELYTYLSNLFTLDIKDFNNKTLAEKYSYIVSVASDLKDVIGLLQENKKIEAVQKAKIILNKFLTTGNLDVSANSLIDILKKQYNIPEVKKQENTINTLVKPENK